MGQNGRRSHRRTWALLTLIALSVGLVGWHYQAAQRGHASPPEALVRAITRPIQWVLSEAVSHLSGAWHFVGHLGQLEEENRRLRALLAVKEAQIDQLMEIKLRAERLERLVNFKQEPLRPQVTARVIGRSPTPLMQMLILNVGRRDRVAPKDIVMAQGGLVGYVYQVSRNTCHVLLLTDRHSGVGARVQPARARTEGVCKGTGGPECLLKYLPNDANIREGDTVVSSGQGRVFPPGLVIGKITSVRRNDYDSSLEARVRPHVDFRRLEEVQVLLAGGEEDAP